MREDADQEDDEADERARRMCTLHAHLLLALRNCRADELTQPLVQTLICGMIFLSTRHQWNHKQYADEFGSQEGAASYDDWRVPETELFECLHVVRRKLVLWVRQGGASQLALDQLMDAVVRVSESEGSLLPKPDEARMRWAPITGDVNRGRFQQNGSRTTAAAGAAGAEGSNGGASVAAEASLTALPTVAESTTEMQVDVQVMQLTLTGAQPQALDSNTAKDQDVVTVFGVAAMQAVLMERSSLRSIYRIVGRSHTIARWMPCQKLPVQVRGARGRERARAPLGTSGRQSSRSRSAPRTGRQRLRTAAPTGAVPGVWPSDRRSPCALHPLVCARRTSSASTTSTSCTRPRRRGCPPSSSRCGCAT